MVGNPIVNPNYFSDLPNVVLAGSQHLTLMVTLSVLQILQIKNELGLLLFIVVWLTNTEMNEHSHIHSHDTHTDTYIVKETHTTYLKQIQWRVKYS